MSAPSNASPSLNLDHVYQAGLLHQAISTLEARMRDQPPPAPLLERLGQLYRMTGDLARCAACFRQLRDMGAAGPDHLEWLRIQDGEAARMDAAGQVWPAPFVLMPDFLDTAVLAELKTAVEKNHERFQAIPLPDETGTPKAADPKVRQGHYLDIPELEDWVLAKVRALLPDLMTRLGVRPFPVGAIERQVTLHEEGGHFLAHRDDLLVPRRISFGCYFHFGPRRFSGGDLLLLDGDRQSAAPASNQYTRILYRDNAACFFRSDCFHQATAVRILEPGARSGRYAVIGHVWEAQKGAP
jgi:Rps23 Pro-64 3,4-dihydroxylase Tpa1-like proline 4-hydroxylase